MASARFCIVLMLAFSVPPSVAEDSWSGVERVVAIGDVHGDYGQFVILLRQAGIVNEKERWAGGNTHLVQTGDVPDRGPDTRKIMDLLMELEKQSRRAGGQVHALIGNHDSMNVYGDLRYVTPEEFAAFRDANSERVREAFWDEHVESVKKEAASRDEEPQIDGAAKQKWYDEHPLGYFEHRFAWGPNGKYGKWVRSHNAVIKIDGSLFLHGGIGPRFASNDIRTINERVRAELNDFSLLKEGITIASDGPLWYRGLAQGDEQELEGSVDQTLKHYGVERIVIGHTPTAGTVMPRFGGKVLMIDVGLSAHYGGRLACLVIEKGTPYTLHRGRRLDLPDGSLDGLLRYLRAAADLDPSPSPLAPLVQQMESAITTAGRQ